VAMTAPVRVRVMPGQGPACVSNFTMSFYVSKLPAPQPTDPTVELTKLPALKAYVKSFGGRPKEADWVKQADALAAALPKSAKVEKDFFFTAGYDSPFKLFYRHNEVWILDLE